MAVNTHRRSLATALALLFAVACTAPTTNTQPAEHPAQAPRSVFTGLDGLWVGHYGAHGLELIELRTASDGRITATKLVGDVNVPAGQVTFVADQNGVGHGMTAGAGFKNPTFVPGTLIVHGPDRIEFSWAGVGPIVFARVGKDTADEMLARAQQSAPPSSEQVAQRAIALTVVVKTSNGMGSGFVVPGGLIVTNLHVVAGQEAIAIRLPSGQELVVQDVRGVDRQNDLALLNANLSSVGLALSEGDGISVGAPVMAVGNPQGLAGTVTAGVVSSVRKHPTLDFELIQMDAAISPGSSGGPVLDGRGRVIGVSRFIVQGGQNLNFAIPIRYAKALLRQSEGPISMGSFAAATAPPSDTPRTAPAARAANKRPAFPNLVAGFSFGSDLAAAMRVCLDQMRGSPAWAYCARPPVTLSFAKGPLFLTFQGGELTEAYMEGTTWGDVSVALQSKYGAPDLVEAPAKNKSWEAIKTWKNGKPGRGVWFLDGGRIVAASLNGKDIAVLYVSDRAQALQQQNY